MARPTKQGLDYFSFDVDFYDNKKIRRILRGCGPASGSILTCLLCDIYRGKGYYILWNEDLPFDIADKVGVSEGSVSEVITKSLQVDFFDQYQYDKNKILTSEEIQKRYRAGTLKRNDVVINDIYLVTEEIKRVIADNNLINAPGNEQSKVKETKVNESKRANALVGVADPSVNGQVLKNKYKDFVVGLNGKERNEIWIGLKTFITEEKPEFIEPYVDTWRLFASTYKLPSIDTISDSRRKKFKTRISEPAFDFYKVLEKIKTSGHLKGDNQRGWTVTFDWIIENDKNYLKIMEGQYN